MEPRYEPLCLCLGFEPLRFDAERKSPEHALGNRRVGLIRAALRRSPLRGACGVQNGEAVLSNRSLQISSSLQQIPKRPRQGAVLVSGGERGINAARRAAFVGSQASLGTNPLVYISGSNPVSETEQKSPHKGGFLCSGGERGIRTLEGLLTLTPLAGERFRPLSHLSGGADFSCRQAALRQRIGLSGDLRTGARAEDAAYYWPPLPG